MMNSTIDQPKAAEKILERFQGLCPISDFRKTLTDLFLEWSCCDTCFDVDHRREIVLHFIVLMHFLDDLEGYKPSAPPS